MNKNIAIALAMLLFNPCLLFAEPGDSNNNRQPRFVDNGDGTITDNQTGLMWHQKGGANDGIQDPRNPHDVDNLYTWTDTADGDNTNPDGTAFTDYLARLNGIIADFSWPVNNDIASAVSEQLGGYSDWRLPSLAELVNLWVEECYGSEPPSCLDPLFVTPARGLPVTTWTSTTDAINPERAYSVSTDNSAGTDVKWASVFVRAVRNIK